MAAEAVFFVDGATSKIFDADFTAKNLKGIYLSEGDLMILHHIYTHRLVESSKVHILFQVEHPSKTTKSISNRLSKLIEYNILKRKKSDLKSIRFCKYYYYIGDIGYEVLKQYVPHLIGSYTPKLWRIPKAHNENCTNAIIEAHRENRLREQPFEIQYSRGSYHDVIRERASRKDWCIPDYILQFGNLLICIEYDMGTEALSFITEKAEKYAAMYETLQAEGYRLAVLYLTTRGIDDKISFRRIQSMKSAHETIYSKVQHIPIYVVDERELYRIVQKLCTGTYPYQHEQKEYLLERAQLLERENNQKSKAYRAQSLELSEMLLEKKDADLFPGEFMFRADQFYEHRGTIKSVVYCVGEIGSVHTYIQLRIANSIFAKTNETLLLSEIRPIELLVTYGNVSNKLLMKELLGIHPRIDIRLQSGQEVEHAHNSLALREAGEAEWWGVYNYSVQRLKYVSAFKMIWEEHQ